jgi:hypothetical protein
MSELHELREAAADLRAAAAEAREAAGELREARTRDALGPDALLPYGEFLKANGLSYELGDRLRREGTLKVLRAGGKLVVRAGHAAEFARALPLAKPAAKRTGGPRRRRTA